MAPVQTHSHPQTPTSTSTTTTTTTAFQLHAQPNAIYNTRYMNPVISGNNNNNSNNISTRNFKSDGHRLLASRATSGTASNFNSLVSPYNSQIVFSPSYMVPTNPTPTTLRNYANSGNEVRSFTPSVSSMNVNGMKWNTNSDPNFGFTLKSAKVTEFSKNHKDSSFSGYETKDDNESSIKGSQTKSNDNIGNTSFSSSADHEKVKVKLEDDYKIKLEDNFSLEDTKPRKDSHSSASASKITKPQSQYRSRSPIPFTAPTSLPSSSSSSSALRNSKLRNSRGDYSGKSSSNGSYNNNNNNSHNHNNNHNNNKSNYGASSSSSSSSGSNLAVCFKNDYSNHYVHSGVLPIKYIRNISEKVEGYPKLQKLLKLKEEQISKHSTKGYGSRVKPENMSRVLNDWCSNHNIGFDVIMIGALTENQLIYSLLFSLPIDKLCNRPGFLFIWASTKKISELSRLLSDSNSWAKRFRRSEELIFVPTDKNSPYYPRDSDIPEEQLCETLQWHCWMCITGTVRRSTDNKLIHCNIDTDLSIENESTKKSAVPDQIYKVAENFSSSTRRLHIIPSRSGIDNPVRLRKGWVIMSPDVMLNNFEPNSYKSEINKVGTNIPLNDEIEQLRPKSPSSANNYNNNNNNNNNNNSNNNKSDRR
ncbi:hypothetical protein B5S33_g1988 [[Candida] boidinii]|nr:hypothetical protein B5S30_g3495 [[Candida] boidinii]OWB83359.1 hypothetical protein B5S33_g1988 [[Candida] boidinii]